MTGSAPTGTPSDRTRRAQLLELLERSADPDGFVPFDRFMDVALYAPHVGYYAREDSPFGPEGDFYTAAHASPLFGRTVAERVRTIVAELPAGETIRVLDVGPGDGTLAESILPSLAEDRAFRERSEYVLVERSAVLATRAFARLSELGDRLGIPVRAIGGIGGDGPFHGVVIANELLDAQPTRRLRWTAEGWSEMGVRVQGGRLEPASSPLRRPVPGPALPSHPPPGTTLEVSPMAEGLLREVADHLVSGLCIMIDYGMEESELIAAHPSGTLSAVRGHRYVDDFLEDPGGADLSVFVNFTRVRAAALAAGLRVVAFRRQAEALGEWGYPRLLEAAVRSAPTSEAEVRLRLGSKNLLFGFERFCALELAPARGAGT